MTLPTTAQSSSVNPTTALNTNSTILPKKRPHDDKPSLLNKKHQLGRRSGNCSSYTQACLLLHAIEINRRRPLNPHCVAFLANYVAQSWETNPDEAKIQRLYQLMQNLLSTTAIKQPTLEEALTSFCQNSASTPTPCPSVTLLIAIGYIQRLNKKYDSIKGTVGCGSRLIIIAYLMAAKFLQANLRLIIRTPSSLKHEKKQSSSTMQSIATSPVSPPTSPPSFKATTYTTTPPTTTPTTPPHTPLGILNTTVSQPLPLETPTSSNHDRYLRIMRLELEFLYFLDYDLSTADPAKLICWAHTFDTPLDDGASADEADDELEDDEDMDTCTLD